MDFTPDYSPCSFASQTFIWFADFLIIALILCQKLILLYFNILLCTRKNRFNVQKRSKTKKNSRYIYSNCSSTSINCLYFTQFHICCCCKHLCLLSRILDCFMQQFILTFFYICHCIQNNIRHHKFSWIFGISDICV